MLGLLRVDDVPWGHGQIRWSYAVANDEIETALDALKLPRNVTTPVQEES